VDILVKIKLCSNAEQNIVLYNENQFRIYISKLLYFMRYLLLLCFLFFSGFSYAILPSESTDTSLPTAEEEIKSKKEINKQQKIEKKADKKEKRQLKKQTQKLKWQLLKNAFKTHKTNKKLNEKDRKGGKPIYWASWISALFGLSAFGLIVLNEATLLLSIGLYLLSISFGIVALILAVIALQFFKKKAKEGNDNYNRTISKILAVLGGLAGFITLFFFIALLIAFGV
jgi:cation transport ATPase